MIDKTKDAKNRYASLNGSNNNFNINIINGFYRKFI